MSGMLEILGLLPKLETKAGELANVFSEYAIAEAKYKRDYASWMISPSNDGKNKEQREAFAESKTADIADQLAVLKGKLERARLEYEALKTTNATHRAILVSGLPKDTQEQ